jgi:hypothetical protein
MAVSLLPGVSSRESIKQTEEKADKSGSQPPRAVTAVNHHTRAHPRNLAAQSGANAAMPPFCEKSRVVGYRPFRTAGFLSERRSHCRTRQKAFPVLEKACIAQNSW